MAKIKLSIRLIKEGYGADGRDDDILIMDGEKKPEEMRLDDQPGNGKLYYVAPEQHPASNINSFFQLTGNDRLNTYSLLRIAYVARIRIDGEERIFVVNFGNPIGLIRKEAVEPQFGLKIILNDVSDGDLRKISRKCIGTNQKCVDEQLPFNGEMNDFDFDSETDLVKALSGKSDNLDLDKAMLSGSDAISLSVDGNILCLDTILTSCYRIYKKDDYKRKFAWFDNIKAVEDANLIKALDKKLLDKIKADDFSQIRMDVPDMIEWGDVNGFAYITGHDYSRTYPDVDIRDAIAEIIKEDGEPITMDSISGNRVYAMSDDDKIIKSWNIYDCIYSELEYGDDGHEPSNYCLVDGEWRVIEKSYYKRVTRNYSKIKSSDARFPVCYSHEGRLEDETTYNDCLRFRLNGLETHGISVSVDGHGGKVEACDVYSRKSLMFIKLYRNSSAPLSHLFNQACVACGEWKDPGFLKGLKKAMAKDKKITEKNRASAETIPDEIDDVSSYKVILGIACREEKGKGRKDRLPDIPFLSKAVACRTSKEIESLGFKFEMKNIKVVEAGPMRQGQENDEHDFSNRVMC